MQGLSCLTQASEKLGEFNFQRSLVESCFVSGAFWPFLLLHTHAGEYLLLTRESLQAESQVLVTQSQKCVREW